MVDKFENRIASSFLKLFVDSFSGFIQFVKLSLYCVLQLYKGGYKDHVTSSKALARMAKTSSLMKIVGLPVILSLNFLVLISVSSLSDWIHILMEYSKNKRRDMPLEINISLKKKLRFINALF